MNAKLFCLSATGFLLLLVSCNKTLYRAEAVHDPMIGTKKEGSANLSVPVAPFSGFPSIDLSGGFAPTDHLILKGAFRLRSMTYNTYEWNFSSYSTSLFGISAEAGAGYSRALANKNRINLFGNLAYGYNQHGDLNNKFVILSAQPSLLLLEARSRIGIGARVGAIHFLHIDASGDALYESKSGKRFPVVDPYFSYELGGKQLNFYFQISMSYVSNALATEESTVGRIAPKFVVGVNKRFIPKH
ncbi:MAG: hypothetical protein JNM21_00490 [Taibaiella sp.]|nr:hypothetical protein [Taibaiella sp.]